ncbi:MAG: hypothetical protein HGB29_08830 [Chlorobiaceae bacterium]|nr:hypothetical protein [Chlorobiaceae bacterium]NTW74954.1 hypothetical protein [Chlorobiaceae bacterium]
MGDSPHRRISGPTVVTAGLSLLVFAYVATRAATLCITIDEAATYLWHVRGGWLDIILFSTTGLPDNNHVLYTLLAKVSVLLFGLSELTLRIPSLLGCLLYLLGLNLCLRRIVTGWKIVPALLAVGLNPYVVDFLGVARGYGLGLGFTMLGISALLSAFAETPGKVRVAPAQLGMVLFGFAALSNLSFLLLLGAAMLLVVGFVVVSGLTAQRDSATGSSPWPILLFRILLPAIPFLAYLMLPLIIIRNWKLFGEGGHTGFWADTVTGLVQGTAYYNPWFWSYIDAMMIWVVVVSLFVPIALLVLRRMDDRKFVVLAVLALLTLTVAVASIVQHHLLHVAFLQGRRAIFLTPLFLLTAIAIGEPPRRAPGWYLLPAMLIGLLGPSVLAVTGVAATNLDKLYEWNEYSGTRSAMLMIRQEIGRQTPGHPRKLRVNTEYEHAMNFYRIMYGMERVLMPVESEGLAGSADFYYGFIRDESTMTGYGARPMLRQPESGTILCGRSDGVDAP